MKTKKTKKLNKRGLIMATYKKETKKNAEPLFSKIVQYFNNKKTNKEEPKND